jgi:hypothetical protein
MWRPAAHLLLLTVLAAGLAGCGGKKSAAPVSTATGTPTLTSASDRTACGQLEANIRLVSQLVSGGVEAMTHSLRPKQLAKRTGDTQKYLAYAANVLATLDVPGSLVPAQHQLVAGLRAFAADFGHAQRSVRRNDLATAARQLVDRPALAKVSAATEKIDRACGA